MSPASAAAFVTSIPPPTIDWKARARPLTQVRCKHPVEAQGYVAVQLVGQLGSDAQGHRHNRRMEKLPPCFA